MNLIKKIKNRYFSYVMHSGNNMRKEKELRKILYYLGENTRIYSDSFGSEPWLLSIGSDTIVASGVKFIQHDASYYNAYRFLHKKAIQQGEKMGAIMIGVNCFIGADAVILGGSKIGDNSIIAAAAVVHGNIPPNEVWGGVPAKYIMNTEEYAKKIDLHTMSLPWIINNQYKDMNEKELKQVKQKYYFELLNKGINL